MRLTTILLVFVQGRTRAFRTPSDLCGVSQVQRDGVDHLTPRSLRQQIEKHLGLEAGALAAQKKVIAKLTDEVLASLPSASAADDPVPVPVSRESINAEHSYNCI